MILLFGCLVLVAESDESLAGVGIGLLIRFDRPCLVRFAKSKAFGSYRSR